MNKKYVFVGICIFLVLCVIFLIGQNTITGYFLIENEKIRLGYCPTMGSYAEKTAEENNYELVLYPSSGIVFNELNNGNIHKGIVGRRAKSYELNDDINEEILIPGYTLIFTQKNAIFYGELDSIVIHTYIEKNVTQKMLPNSYMFYHESIEKAIEVGFANNEPILISWEDWRDDFELLIPVDIFGNKIEDFRTPILYSSI